jgi:hypothetical protein
LRIPVAQKADIDGADNFTVQIERDRNTVNLRGLAHLTPTGYLTSASLTAVPTSLTP